MRPPAECAKCHGSGRYGWGPIINGVQKHGGPCHSCGGKGHQTKADIRRNVAYNHHKLATISL
jgi:DnaJ-class molecular chaperone